MFVDKIMRAFLAACYARPEYQAVVSDHVAATREQAVYVQALGDAAMMLAGRLRPGLDITARVAWVGEIGQALLVASPDTPGSRARPF